MSNPDRKFLVFLVQETLYALDLDQVAEVMDPPPSWPIPRVPSYYHGAINFHGSIVAVMDLAALLGLPVSENHHKLVVLNPDIASLAFLADRVSRIVSEHGLELLDAPGRELTSSLLVLPEGEALLLDLNAVVQRVESAIEAWF